MTDWDRQRARDRGEGYFPGEVSLAQKLGAARRQAEQEQAQAAADFNATPQGELAGLELEIAELGAQMTEAQWQATWAERGETPPGPKPQEADLPLSSRNRLQQIRLHELMTSKENR
jgi:hypothetical protein